MRENRQAICSFVIGCLIVTSANSQTGGTSSRTSKLPETTAQPAIWSNINEWVEIDLSEPMEPVTKYVGERITLECGITGSPVPTYTWYKDGQVIDPANSRINIKVISWGIRLRINSLELEDAGVYKCVGENTAGNKNTSATLTVRPVSTTVTVPPNQFDDVLDDLIPPYFPDAANPTPRGDDDEVDSPLCQDYKGTYCAFLSAESIYATSRTGQVEAENDVIGMANQLSMYLRAESECFQKSMRAMCYLKMPLCGPRNPLGVPSVLRLCKAECQELFFVCRKEFEEQSIDWKILPECFDLNDDPGCLRIGLIPTVSPNTVEPKQKGVDKADEKTEEDVVDLLLQIVLPIVLGLIAVVVLLIVIICWRRRVSQSSSNASCDSRLNSSTAKGYEQAMSGSEKSAPAAVFLKDIPRGNIHFLQELGAGTFGKVHKGQVFGLYGNGTASLVFVKTLKDNSSISEQREFDREIESMTDIRHQHIISLLGVSTIGSPQCMLYEYLPSGNLHQYLLTQQAHGSTLQHQEVMYMLTQIASGLEYLASQKCIHKDIAARNVIVGNNLNVKLSNLKIIYGLNSSDYCPLHGMMMPLRWCPPEAITYGQFNLETDVYSYGILMWEVFSSGQQPYSGFSNDDAIEMIRSRQLLACPTNCPPRVYSLMMECWHEMANKRPLAKEVHQKMRTWYLDNGNLYAISTTSAPSVSNSSAPSHHSSTGPSYPSNHTNTTDMRYGDGPPTSPKSLQKSPYPQLQLPPNQSEKPPYYNTLYPDTSYSGQMTRPESTSLSESSLDNDDDESEFSMPIPNNAVHMRNPYSSLNRRGQLPKTEYNGTQLQPFLAQDHV